MRGRCRRLGPRRKGLLDEALPRFSVASSSDHLSPFLASFRHVWIEIGFGAGEHLLEQARAHPDVGIIGCELFPKGVASLVGKLVEHRIENVRIFPDDAHLLLKQLPPKCVSCCFILFPDPWPKKRHHKRRLLTEELLHRLASLMVPEGRLVIATDHTDYLRHMLYLLTVRTDSFTWQEHTPEAWYSREDGLPPTRYEKKALGGRAVYLRFARTHPPPLERAKPG